MLTLYRTAFRLAAPILRRYLARRAERGKEDPVRLSERFGIASAARPAGRLTWVHAASVGEANSSFILIERLLAEGWTDAVLLTTGTVTSAELAARRLPQGALHQYCPLDHPDWVGRFLDHWRPDAALWIEEEIWPTLIAACAARGTPMGFVNARLSGKSARQWGRAAGLFRDLMGRFSVILCQTDAIRETFASLGITHAVCRGNLKFSARPLPADPDQLSALRAAIGDRPVWVAASTHPGEEAMACEAHARLLQDHPDLLLILAPRHPVRSAEVVTQCLEAGFSPVIRSTGATPGREDSLYLADTLGELGLWFAVSPIVYLGGGMADHGGHNPIEPAQHGCAVLYGPDRRNFTSVADQLEQAGAAEVVNTVSELEAALEILLADKATVTERQQAGRTVAEENAGIINAVLTELSPLFPDRSPPGFDRS